MTANGYKWLRRVLLVIMAATAIAIASTAQDTCMVVLPCDDVRLAAAMHQTAVDKWLGWRANYITTRRREDEYIAAIAKADSALAIRAEEVERLRASFQDAMKATIAAQDRQQRLKGWATVGKVSVGLLGLGVGLYTYQQLQP